MRPGDDLIADAKWLGDEEQNAREEIMNDVPECEADRDAANAKHLHNVPA